MTKKDIYLEIIKSYCKIPLVPKTEEDIFKKQKEETLSKMIMNTVIPGVIHFYGHSLSENKNYLILIQEIINNLKKSEYHFKEFQKLLDNISRK